MRTVFGPAIQVIQFADSRRTELNAQVAATAARLGASTPPNRQVRVAGMLDMIRHSTRSFSLRLSSGEEVHGVMESSEDTTLLRNFFGKPVLVLGRAVYRPSGRLLRLDAAALEDGAGAPAVFNKVPPPQTVPPSAPARPKPSDAGKRGVAAFFGIWPGEETDAEFDSLVRDLRAGMAPVR